MGQQLFSAYVHSSPGFVPPRGSVFADAQLEDPVKARTTFSKVVGCREEFVHAKFVHVRPSHVWLSNGKTTGNAVIRHYRWNGASTVL